MTPILEFLPALSVYPYALLYYAVLLASAGLALFAFRRAKPANNSALRGALLVIFFSQLFLLTLSLMIYQGFPQLNQIFPIAFRALTLVCILWLLQALIWQPGKRQGWVIWGLTAAVLTAGSILVPFWLPLAGTQSFNGSWQDLTWVGLTLLTIAVGAIIHLRTDRSERVEGILILVLAAMGYLFYLALPNSGSLPAAVMVSQLLYYPLLISLAWQRAKPNPNQQPATTNVERRELAGEVAVRMLDVSLQRTNTQIQRSLTHSLGLYLMADLCGILAADGENQNLTLLNMYDLIREEFLGTIELPKTAFPVLTAHFEDREELVSNSPADLAKEKASLMGLIGYNQIGNLLFYPLNAADAASGRGLLCLSPFTERAWSQKELDPLRVIAPKVNEILNEADEIEQRVTSAQKLQTMLNRVQRDRAQTVEQFLQSQDLLAKLQEELHISGQTHESEVEMWLARQESLEEQLEDLQAALRQNEATIAQAEALRLEKEQLERSMEQNARQAQGLRAALDQARDMLDQMNNQSESLDEALKSLLAEMKADFELKQIHVRLENTLNRTPNPGHTRQLVELSRSLLRNAAGVSKNGSEVVLEVLASEDFPGFAELRVSDAGPGLKPEEQAALLERLKAGPGVGEPETEAESSLREAADLAESLGGHWWIHSVPDTLTIHRVAVPIESKADAPGNNLATSSTGKS